MHEKSDHLLSVEGLSVVFDAGKPTAHRALDHVSLSIAKGEILGLVGESGSGKTVLSHSVLGLLPENGRITSGAIEFGGKNLIGLADEQMRRIRGKKLAMIFQDPQASLNPVYTVGRQLTRLLKLHRDLSGKVAKEKAIELLGEAHLSNPERVFERYPHELSGGMSQRVMIAMALSGEPELLIADEPTSALDVTIQAGIAELLRSIRVSRNMAILFISHDLALVAQICDRISVIRCGRIEEEGTTEEVICRPTARYTQELLRAVPALPRQDSDQPWRQTQIPVLI